MFIFDFWGVKTFFFESRRMTFIISHLREKIFATFFKPWFSSQIHSKSPSGASRRPWSGFRGLQRWNFKSLVTFQKCSQSVHIWFLGSSNTFFECRRMTFTISHLREKILTTFFKPCFSSQICSESPFGASWEVYSRNYKENEKCKKDAQKVLRLHF